MVPSEYIQAGWTHSVTLILCTAWLPQPQWVKKIARQSVDATMASGLRQSMH